MDNQPKTNSPDPADFFAKVDNQFGQSVPPPPPAPTPQIDYSAAAKNAEMAQPGPAEVSVSPGRPSSFAGVGNKENIKKILLIFAAGLLVLGLFFFISSFISKGKGGKEITLTYWGLWEPEKVIAPIIDDYQKLHPLVKIKYVMESTGKDKNYRERLISAIEGGSGPDIFRFHNTWAPMLKGVLATLPASVMDKTTFAKTYYGVTAKDLLLGNEYVGLPLYMDTLALFYNEKIFEEKGKSPPKDLFEFEKLASELTVRDAQGKIQVSGAAIGVTTNIDHWSDILGLIMLQNGAKLSKPGDDKASDAIKYYTKFYRNRIWDETLPTSTYLFAMGKLAMYFGPSWRVFDIKYLNKDLRFKVIPFPQIPGNEVGWATYWVEGVSRRSQHQAEAWEFLKYLSSKEVLQKLYQQEGQERLFGEPYPRIDMAETLKKDPFASVFLTQAGVAKSWYLCSRTFDNGLNDLIIQYYENAINSFNKNDDPQQAIVTLTNGVSQTLVKFGINPDSSL